MITLSAVRGVKTTSTLLDVLCDGEKIGQVERLGRRWCNNTHPCMYSTRQEAVDDVVRSWRFRQEVASC